MSAWKVKMTQKAEREFKSLVIRGWIDREDIRVIRSWMEEMELNGPDAIAKSKLWDDHALQYEWFGFRASSFSHSGRIIYRIIDHEIIVEVHRITPNHDYRR